MTSVKDLRKVLADFERTPESRGFDLRLALADLVIRHLRRKGWTQKKLAEEAGMKESFVTRIIHAEQNCTFDVAGRLLFGLDVRANLIEEHPEATSPSLKFVSHETRVSAAPFHYASTADQADIDTRGIAYG